MNLTALLIAAVQAFDNANTTWDLREIDKPLPEEANDVAVDATGSDDEYGTQTLPRLSSAA